MTATRASLIRWPFAAGFFMLGALLTYPAVSALMNGRPQETLLLVMSIVAVGAVPASIVFTVPTFVLGLFLVMFRAARNTGVLLSAYCGAYLGGVITGVVAFVWNS